MRAAITAGSTIATGLSSQQGGIAIATIPAIATAGWARSRGPADPPAAASANHSSLPTVAPGSAIGIQGIAGGTIAAIAAHTGIPTVTAHTSSPCAARAERKQHPRPATSPAAATGSPSTTIASAAAVLPCLTRCQARTASSTSATAAPCTTRTTATPAAWLAKDPAAVSPRTAAATRPARRSTAARGAGEGSSYALEPSASARAITAIAAIAQQQPSPAPIAPYATIATAADPTGTATGPAAGAIAAMTHNQPAVTAIASRGAAIGTIAEQGLTCGTFESTDRS